MYVERGLRRPEQTEGCSCEDRQGGCLTGWPERGWNMEVLALRMRNHLIRCRFTTRRTTVELPGYIPVFAHSTRPVDIRRAFGRWHLFEQSPVPHRSEEHTSELQSLMRISYAVFCLTKQ